MSGKSVQWKSPPARFMRRFALAGWDVIKINRDNLNENGWIASAGKHIAHLVSLAKKARSDGYRHIIAAGQSYGGAISLEAGAEANLFHGVIASAPGHGSDACGSGTNTFRISDTLTKQLVDTIERNNSTRILLTMAKGDECMGFNEPADSLRKALIRSKTSFVFLDDKMPIRGHFAALRRQFSNWYGKCLLRFFDPDSQPQPNENFCNPPSPLPKFLLPEHYEIPTPRSGEKSLVGAWSGDYDVRRGNRTDTRDLCLIIESDLGGGLVTKLAFGAGRRLKLNMSTRDRTFNKDGSVYAYVGRKNYRIELMPDSNFSKIGMRITSTSGNSQWSTTLRRGCSLHH